MEVKVEEESLDGGYNENILPGNFVTVKIEDCRENFARSAEKPECNYNFDPTAFLEGGTGFLKEDTNPFTPKLPGNSKCRQPSNRKVKYRCPVCMKNFTSATLRKQHVDIHFGKCLTLCPICGYMCGKTSEFLTHYFIHRLKPKLTHRFNPMKLPHTNLSKNLKYQPKIGRCKKFYKKSNFKCRNCTESFPCRIFFRKHACFSNRAKIVSKASLRCKICLKMCSTKFSLSNHLKVHKIDTVICGICSKQFLRDNFYKHYRTHIGHGLFETDTHFQPSNNHQCNVCFKEFPGKTHLETHMYDHAGVKPFMCEFCSKEFVRTDSLKTHLKGHLDDKKFQCDVCQRRFVRRITLVEHYRTHTGEKPFKCDICPKSFTQKSQLRSHTRTHVTEKPFVCEICSKQFVIQFQLKRHLLTHNPKKRFECEICFKQFIEKRNLNAHLLLHAGTKPFKCELCSKAFTWRHNLNRHVKVHEDNAFECDVCQEKFSRYHILQNHYRTHTGEVPYKCDICSKQFKQKITLTTHMLNHDIE